MTTPTTSGTTDGDDDGARRRFARVSVRTRITVVIALLTAVAMTGAGLLVYALESARIERQVNAQISQEIAEFRALRIDPNTGEEFDDVGRVLNVFLTRNVPDDDEMLVGYVRGETPERTANRYGQEVLDEPAYQDALADLDGVGGTRVIESPTFGETWVTLVPVTNTQGEGSLVIVNFLRDEHEELDRTLQTYTLIALLSLGLITTIAAFQSGRLLAPLRTLESTAREITTTDLSRRIPERGNDDITALTRTINSMLERLDSGFAASGSSSTTPATSSRPRSPSCADTSSCWTARTPPSWPRPASSSSTRSTACRDSCRTSSCSRRAAAPTSSSWARCDLAELTQSVLAKATALGDREWQLDGVAGGRAVLDEQRVTQALLQLADNAVKHTDPGDRRGPRLGARGRPGAVVGPRLPATGSRPRTARPSSSGSAAATSRAGDDGFGLGLSIVRAIADAHGGDVRITDAQPRGAHVEIVLPDREIER